MKPEKRKQRRNELVEVARRGLDQLSKLPEEEFQKGLKILTDMVPEIREQIMERRRAFLGGDN